MKTDKELIKAVRKRQSTDAANELVSRYYKEIYAYAYRQMEEKDAYSFAC